MASKQWLLPLRFSILIILLLIFSLVFSFLAARFQENTKPTLTEPQPPFSTVILDAGHGGEDGGAVSPQGYFEKDINLAICEQMRTMLLSNGVNTVMTRTEDVLLYDKNVDYQGRKKALDLLARRRIGEETPDSLFVSIHMNAYPLSQYTGLQVWYSPNDPSSVELARQIQTTVSSHLQPQNDRQVKAAGSNIYLLHHLRSPALLVECGFLSNPEEAERLHDPEYQRQLAFLISLSLLQGENQGEK